MPLGCWICFTTFLVRNHRIANNSATTPKLEKTYSADLEFIEFYKLFWCVLDLSKIIKIYFIKLANLQWQPSYLLGETYPFSYMPAFLKLSK